MKGGKLIKFITKEEYDKLMKSTKDRELKMVMSFGFCSGLRISEIIGYKGKSRKKNKKTGEIIETEIIIPKLTADSIDLQTHQIKLFNAKGRKDRVTVTPPNLTVNNIKLLPINTPRRTLQYRFSQLAKKVLKKRMSLHTLRHGFGNFMVNVKQVPMPMIQQMMGHSRIDSTGIYTKSNPVDAINKAWESF